MSAALALALALDAASPTAGAAPAIGACFGVAASVDGSKVAVNERE